MMRDWRQGRIRHGCPLLPPLADCPAEQASRPPDPYKWPVNGATFHWHNNPTLPDVATSRDPELCDVCVKARLDAMEDGWRASPEGQAILRIERHERAIRNYRRAQRRLWRRLWRLYLAIPERICRWVSGKINAWRAKR